VRVKEIVGRRIAQRREELGLSRGDLGRQVREPLGKAWSRQIVANIEAGLRDLTQDELLAVAIVLDIPVGRLFAPDMDTPSIEFASGMKADPLGVEIATASAEQRDALAGLVADIADLVTNAGTGLVDLAGQLHSIEAKVRRPDDLHEGDELEVVQPAQHKGRVGRIASPKRAPRKRTGEAPR
jgi:transcriptional regulator with XRE-family HTH domain